MINLCLTALIPRGQRLDFNSSNLGSPSAWLVWPASKGSQYTRHQNASRPSPGGDAATADAQALDRGQDGVRYHVSDADACPASSSDLRSHTDVWGVHCSTASGHHVRIGRVYDTSRHRQPLLLSVPPSPVSCFCRHIV